MRGEALPSGPCPAPDVDAGSSGKQTRLHRGLQQATLAIRARVPLQVLEDVIQPFPTFSEAFLNALLQLRAEAAVRA